MRKIALTALICVLFALQTGFAMSLPVISTTGDKMPFVVRHQAVTVEVYNHLVKTNVTQTIYNDGDLDVPCYFDLRLPDGAHASHLEAQVDGKTYVARIETKSAARAIVDETREQGMAAALAEENNGVLHVELSVVLSHQEFIFTVSYIEEAVYDADGFNYWFGLAKFNSEMPEPATYSLDVTFDCTADITSVKSEYHTLVGKTNGKKAAYSIEDIYITKKDFHLVYTLALEPGKPQLMLMDNGKEDPYFCLLSLPPVSKPENLERSIIFILDKSGSMNSDNKFPLAVESLISFTNGLRPADRMNVFIFENTHWYLSTLPFIADENGRKTAEDFIKGFSAGGGTYILGPTLEAIQQLDLYRANATAIVLLTDGQGRTPAQDFIRQIDNECKFNVPIYVFGIGSDLNFPLLRSLSRYSGGDFQHVVKNEDIGSAVDAMRQRFDMMSGFNMNLETSGKIGYRRYPQRLSLSYANEPVIVYGRLDDNKTDKMTISMDTAAGKWAESIDVTTVGDRQDCPFLDQAWGIRRIQAMLDDENIFGSNAPRRSEIILLSRRYLITTPHTSLVFSELETSEQDRIINENQNDDLNADPAMPMERSRRSLGGKSGGNVARPATPNPSPSADKKSSEKDLREMEKLAKPVAWFDEQSNLLQMDGTPMDGQILAHAVIAYGLSLKTAKLNEEAKDMLDKCIVWLSAHSQEGKISDDLLETVLATLAVTAGKATRKDVTEISDAMVLHLASMDVAAALKDKSQEYVLCVAYFAAKLKDLGAVLPDSSIAAIKAVLETIIPKNLGDLASLKYIDQIRNWTTMLPIAVNLAPYYNLEVPTEKLEALLKVSMSARTRKCVAIPDLVYWLSWQDLITKKVIEAAPQDGLGYVLGGEISLIQSGKSDSLFSRAFGDRTYHVFYMIIN